MSLSSLPKLTWLPKRLGKCIQHHPQKVARLSAKPCQLHRRSKLCCKQPSWLQWPGRGCMVRHSVGLILLGATLVHGISISWPKLWGAVLTNAEEHGAKPKPGHVVLYKLSAFGSLLHYRYKYNYRVQYTVSPLWEVTTQKWINEAFESQMLCLPASISDCDCARHESTVSNQTGLEPSIFEFISLSAWKTMPKHVISSIGGKKTT